MGSFCDSALLLAFLLALLLTLLLVKTRLRVGSFCDSASISESESGGVLCGCGEVAGGVGGGGPAVAGGGAL